MSHTKQVEAASPAASPSLDVQSTWKDVKFTANDVIAAWERGRKDQQESSRREFVDDFVSGLHSAQREAERLFLDIWSETGIRPLTIFMRVRSVAPRLELQALYLVSEADFLSDGISEVFNLAGHREDELEKRLSVGLAFTFIPATDKTSIDTIVSDGFGFRYARSESKSIEAAS